MAASNGLSRRLVTSAYHVGSSRARHVGSSRRLVTSAHHVGSSRRLVTSARHVGSSRSAVSNKQTGVEGCSNLLIFYQNIIHIIIYIYII